MEKLCSVCKTTVDSESASILVMGGFGNPKYICEDCEHDFDDIISGRDYETIKSAMASIGDKLSKNKIDDELVIETLDSIFDTAKERAEKIKDGTYDFSCDEAVDDDEGDDVPEECRESEEDIALDKMESEKIEANAKKMKMLDIAMASVFAALIIGYVIFLILR